MHGHADVFGADRIGVRIQFQAAGDPAQAPVDAGQHRLPFAQQHAGEVAYRQPRFQLVFGDQAQALPIAGQGDFGRERRAGLQRLPGRMQLGAEARGDLVATTAQFAHAVEEQQLRRAGTLGAVEQHIVEMRQRRGEGLAQHWQHALARLRQQARVTRRVCVRAGAETHARRLRAMDGAR
ncbi:hypothetical protein NB723_004039 [Xanthomonas sacchari]|nr:hypothetical protein [Xanthomonas sacchari]